MEAHDGYGRRPERREPTLSRRALFGIKRTALARADVDFDAEAARRRDASSAIGDEYWRAIEPVAEVVASLADVRAGERVLDVGAGNGATALACAGRGAAVDACDGAPALVERGRIRAGDAIRWSSAEATALPYESATFDALVSTFGAARAPRARRAAGELARVLRPGGRLVLASWSPRGLPGRLDEELPPPEGIPAPSTWARAEIARRRLEPHFDNLVARTRTVTLTFPTSDAMFAALVGGHGPPPHEQERLRSRFDALLAAQNDRPGGAQISARYVVLVARRRPPRDQWAWPEVRRRNA